MNLIRLQSNSEKSEASARRKTNIEFVRTLVLDELIYKNNEKQILFYKTARKEQILLQYPGKESVQSDKSNTRLVNPWDFKPKSYINGRHGKDLNFGEVWGALIALKTEHEIPEEKLSLAMKKLALLMYKIAYIIDYKLVNNIELSVRTCSENTDYYSEFTKETFNKKVYVFDIESHLEMIEEIQVVTGNLCGMSVEAFLLYLDVLAWQEDSKYYHRATSKGDAWAGGTGRPNNMMTHMAIISWLMGKFELPTILNRLGNGVCTLTGNQIKDVLSGYIEE